ncbi:MAG: hypothetical protein JO250_17300, partial [Armatimonadetes bacterium]|nr:hypothetical protein [Armatimonadota bacterium]
MFRSPITAALSLTLMLASAVIAQPQPLTPVFSGGQNGPQFRGEFRNDTSKVINLLRLWQESSLLLDGREHGRAVTRWGGTSSLFPGQTWSFTVTPIEYLP